MTSILSSIESSFARIDRRSRELIAKLRDDQMFAKPPGSDESLIPFSCGECLVRSAATVERTFGGITTRLWDDPFEWTLPEKLADKQGVIQYLDEVEKTCASGLSFISTDADLMRAIPAPERLRSLSDILLETLITASHVQGRAFAIFKMISDEKLPRI